MIELKREVQPIVAAQLVNSCPIYLEVTLAISLDFEFKLIFYGLKHHRARQIVVQPFEFSIKLQKVLPLGTQLNIGH
jgi:hypothetical protein